MDKKPIKISKEKKFFLSEKLKQLLIQYVVTETFKKDVPLVYIDEKTKNIHKYWGDGKIEIIEDKATFVCKKAKFPNQEEAEVSLKNIKDTSNRNVIPVRAYLCKCGAWHLTSKRNMHDDANRIQELENEKQGLNDTIIGLNEQLKENARAIKMLKKDNEILTNRILKLNDKWKMNG
jgi:hypothetical protein